MGDWILPPDLMNLLPWLPWEGPPLPKGIFPPWPWVVKPPAAAVGIKALGTLVEGSTVPIQVTVKNTSTKGGVAVPATLSLFVESSTSVTVWGQTLIDKPNVSFTAGQTQTFSATASAPVGTGGQTLKVTGRVYHDSAVVGGPTSIDIPIEFQIVWGATIVIA